MTFDEWLKTNGHGEDLSQQQRGVLHALWQRNRDGADLFGSQLTRDQIDALPDSAFLYLQANVPDGEGRHFPYRDSSGKINVPHLRAAIQRVKQSTAPGLTAAKKTAIQKKARRLLHQAGKPDKASGNVSVPDEDLEILCGAEALEIVAAPAPSEDGADGDEPKLPRIKVTFYTGGELVLMGWYWPVVVDLAGLKVSRKSRPILFQHSPHDVVGHTDLVEIRDGKKLYAEGDVSGTGERAREVVENARNGFPWQASIGARPVKMEFIEEGRTADANGRTFSGPIYVARKSLLGEISIVALGADDATTVKVAASDASTDNEESNMTFEDWLKANGWDPGTITATQRASLEAAWKLTAVQPAPAAAGDPPAEPAPTAPKVEATAKLDEVRDQAIKAERDRRGAIDAACKDFKGEEVERLHAQAISAEISVPDLQAGLLRVLREQRPNPQDAEQEQQGNRNALMACALLHGAAAPDSIVAVCGEPALEAANRMRGFGIQEWIAAAARVDGVELGRYVEDGAAWLQAAFSTMSVPNMLTSVANKLLLDSYLYIEQAWREVVMIRPVKDFKVHQRFRLNADMKFQKVGSTGELQHGSVDEQRYTVQADTFGLLFELSRQDIINDDLGAFTQLPQLLGMGAGEAIAEAVWALVLSNPANHFGSGNSNYQSGAATALSIAGLTSAEQLFLDQTKPNGRPLGVAPTKLVVPTALKVPAERLMNSLELRDTTANTEFGVANPHKGKFAIVCSAYLSNAAIHANASSAAWYLFADPKRLAAFEAAFLNGVDRPTVERSDSDFNTLGVKFRGFVDFGVAVQDPRGAAMSAGA